MGITNFPLDLKKKCRQINGNPSTSFRCRPLDISKSVAQKRKRAFLKEVFHLLQIFREHTLEGSALALLSESHLTGILGLKLGPAMRLLKAIRAL